MPPRQKKHVLHNNEQYECHTLNCMDNIALLGLSFPLQWQVRKPYVHVHVQYTHNKTCEIVNFRRCFKQKILEKLYILDLF